MLRIKLSLIIGGSLLFFCCKNGPRVHHAEDKKYRFTVNPPAGARYHYAIISETESQVEYNDRKLEKSNKVDLAVFYDILKNTPDGILLRITYDKIKITGSDASQAGNFLSDALKADSLIILVKADGNIISQSRHKEIADKILTAARINDPYIKRVFNEQMSQLAGEDFVKNTIQQTFKLFPDSAVYIGDSWVLKNQWPGLIKSDGLTEYTLKAIENGLATIDARAQSSSGSDVPTNIMGYDVQPDIKVRQEARFQTDVSTGMLLSGQSKISVEGTVSVMGRQVPMKMRMARVINGEKKDFQQ